MSFGIVTYIENCNARADSLKLRDWIIGCSLCGATLMARHLQIFRLSRSYVVRGKFRNYGLEQPARPAVHIEPILITVISVYLNTSRPTWAGEFRLALTENSIQPSDTCAHKNYLLILSTGAPNSDFVTILLFENKDLCGERFSGNEQGPEK
jgi:hypothetical protein